MEVNPQKAQAAKDCLDYNPLINTVYVTSNLGCFSNKNAAVNHARGLDDKEIDVFIRNADAAVIDADQTEAASDESACIPDARLAVVNAQPGAKVKPFAKTVKVDTDTPPADPAVDAPAADPAIEAPAADPATDVPAADPAVDVPAAADPAVEAPAGDPGTDVPAADPAVDVPASAVVDNSGIIEKLNHLVEDAETLLGIDHTKTA